MRSSSIAYLVRWDAISVGLLTINDQPAMSVIFEGSAGRLGGATIVSRPPPRSSGSM